jgi:hypothetical protein
MKKVVFLLAVVFSTLVSVAQQTEAYGPFYGLNVYGYKSNLFNSDDFRADSFQTYSMTMSFAGSFEYGYLYDNGFAVSGGLQWGTCNQNYKGADQEYLYKLTANTKTSYLKIPLTFSHQTRNGKKFKFIYSVGFFYSLNTGYSDKIVLDYNDPNVADYETTISKKTISTKNTKDTFKTSYALDYKQYKTHGLGALAGLGFSYRLKERMEFITQLKGEFQFTDAENSDEILYTPTGSTPGNPLLRRTYGNYAKYMSNNQAYKRAATHPFNLGLSLGLRFYVFSF